MDAVGPQVVPSVAEIREKFNARRKTAGRVEQAVRRLLGIDLKMRQYADGARFVRAVVDRIGMDGFNKVWESPDTIPTMSEISNPDAWIARVAGGYATGPAAVTAPVSEKSATAPVNGTSPTSSVGPVTEPAPPADVPSVTDATAPADVSAAADASPMTDVPPAAEAAPVADVPPAASPGTSSSAGEDDEAPAGESSNPWYSASETEPEEASATGQTAETAPDEEERRLWHDGQ
jgi:hypothetical protein